MSSKSSVDFSGVPGIPSIHRGPMFETEERSLVDRMSPIPLHNQLYQLIKQEFTTQFRAGELLPTELELSERFGVGRGTIRNALSVLTSEGILERVAGRGSFLREEYFIRLKRFRVAVILSRAEFSQGNFREETWVHHLEMLNGILGVQAAQNLAVELVPEDGVDASLEAAVDGFLVYRSVSEPLLRRLTKPTVALRYEVDLVRGFSAVGEHLVAHGYQRPVFLGKSGNSRLEAVNRVLTRHARAAIPEAEVIACGGSESEAAQASADWLDRGGVADCWVCSSDLRALGVLETLRARGVRPGAELGVYGFDGIRRASEPTLTTYGFDWTYPGAFAARELRAVLDGRPSLAFTLPQGRLVVGGSTANEDQP